jgi:hypothetical protein
MAFGLFLQLTVAIFVDFQGKSLKGWIPRSERRDQSAAAFMQSITSSNPSLSPDTVIFKFAPRNDLRGFRKNRFNFYQLDGIAGQLRLDHFADQEVLLFGYWRHGRPFG